MEEIRVKLEHNAWVCGVSKIINFKGRTTEDNRFIGEIITEGRLTGDRRIDGNVHTNNLYIILLEANTPEKANEVAEKLAKELLETNE